jgi:hypothetical protein
MPNNSQAELSILHDRAGMLSIATALSMIIFSQGAFEEIYDGPSIEFGEVTFGMKGGC